MLEDMTPPVRIETECKVMKTASSLDPKDRELFIGYLDDKKWVAETLSDALKARGVRLGASVLRRHRRKVCVCYTKNSDA